ncbi:hypothetical protein CBS101457_001959 [Exobasidium rhododendri]|nr:hypothetical protein CBS101457_001959 [Exobasidium rhododendri]
MPLHLQQHKSYHPYSRDNIDRVRRDEEVARLAEEGKEQQSLLAESEARLELLKSKRHKHKGEDGDRLRAAEKELDGKKGALDTYDQRQREKIGLDARPGQEEGSDSHLDKSGHINFWANQEGVRKRQRSEGKDVVSGKRRGNSDYEAEKNAEKQKWEEQNTMFLGKPAKELHPWYQNEDLQSGEEQKKSHEQKLEAAYKDSMIKRSHDPLKAMPSLSAHQEEDVYRDKTSSSSRRDDLRSKAEDRERTERARTEALLASRKAAASGFKIEETPTPARDGYHDQFYREDVRAARGWRQDDARSEQDFQDGPDLDHPGDPTKKGKTETGEGMGEHPTTIKMERTGDEISGKLAAPLRPLDGNAQMKRDDSNSSISTESSVGTDDGKRRPRESMYPAIFGEMITTVLEKESYLFTERERTLLNSFFQMDYEARHLLARLIQRRSNWHRVDKLKYDFDVKDKVVAVSNLCRPVESTANLTEEENDEVDTPTRFCLSEHDMDGGDEEALGLLSLEELKVLAKKMNRLKGSTTTTKASIIASLRTTKSQGTLHGFAASVKKSDNQSNLAFPIKSQSAVLEQQMREIIGGCVRVCPRAQNLINRVALVYYRGAELGGSALTTAVLSRSRKRQYPMYTWQRSPGLFASRKHLIAMEQALSLEVKMDELIEWDGSKEALFKAMKIFESIYDEWKDAVKEGQSLAEGVGATIDRLTYHRMRFHPGWPLTRIVYKGVSVLARFHQHKREAEVLKSLLDQRIFRRGRRGDWYDRLALITAQYPDSTKVNEIRRAKREALSISVEGIQDPDTHLIYHDTLQRRITRLESQLKLPFAEKHDFSYAKLKKCEERIFNGIRLDRMVNTKSGLFGTTFVDSIDAKARPKTGRKSSDSSNSSNSSSSSSDKITSGFQIRKRLHKIVKVEKVKPSIPSVVKGVEDNVDETMDTSGEVEMQTDSRQVKRDMHSVWRGLDNEPCRVEMLVLQHYEMEGYKGYHCEGGILTMLFALLMWDVLFMPLAGVFETPYQRHPLDLSEDSFAIVRGPMIRQRLSDIEELGGLDYIKEADERERQRRTWAVGCKWDRYPQEDLLEIAECMGGRALALICQMLSEEWEKINAGLPDLCVWRYGDRKVKFCEVKGPGDRLSEKQKLWIDILLRAGLDVEVSLVVEEAKK